MRTKDIQKIRYFTKEEIEATGASLCDVKLSLFIGLDMFRKTIGQPVHLIKNGLTTGKHLSIYHKDGLAADFYLDEVDNVQKIVTILFDIGFGGVGCYWNHKKLSFHADLRRTHAMWLWIKDGQKWSKMPLIRDPRQTTYI